MSSISKLTHDPLNGGPKVQEKQALARALSLEPKVLLLDEPLSNLDANLRLVMRGEIRKLIERLQITTIFVTHDQFEAMAISDRLIVLSEGVIQQMGSSTEIYEEPANEFIASFVGHVNFLEGRVESVDASNNSSTISCRIGNVKISNNEKSLEKGEWILLVLRPEMVEIGPVGQKTEGNTFEGEIESTMYVGSMVKYIIA